MKKLYSGIAILLLALLLSAAVFWMVYRNESSKPVVSAEVALVEIPKGASLSQIAQKLQAQHVNIQPFWFKVIAYAHSLAGKLKAGEYELNPGMSTLEVLLHLASGKTKQYSITFPEGWAFKDIIKLLAATPKLDHQLQSAQMADVLKQLGINKPHAEGWFFPATYKFAKGSSDVSILMSAHQKMLTLLEREWQNKQPGLPLKDAYQALILASIVEKETGLASERPEIAGVFIRRLQKGMLLQTDPTVIYGMGDSYKGDIRSKDLKTPTAYNTYVIKGLPPTPIALPGEAAIHAALNPVAGNSLYFVANGGGGHLFSATLAQHAAAVDKYQRKHKATPSAQR